MSAECSSLPGAPDVLPSKFEVRTLLPVLFVFGCCCQSRQELNYDEMEEEHQDRAGDGKDGERGRE